jgi:citrate lyase beta subunit
MRSLLIAPGDDEAKLAAALSSEADAMVIDLVIPPDARAAARPS